jgi:hypothetical protein
MFDYVDLNPKHFLESILQKRTPPVPTGQPLYTYQISQSDYERLKTILQKTFVHDLSHLKKNANLRALFVLYCAEWWRRSFQGGAWNWLDLLSEINMTEAEENKPLLYEVTESGLDYWRRSVLRSSAGRREFLGTFASEGGLPINQLNSQNNWIERVLKSALEKYLKYGSDLNQIIETRFKVVNVPSTFRDEKSSLKETFVKIIEAVYSLNINHRLSEQNDPITFLQDVNPDWRDQFPIPLDSEQGNLLLGSLIKSASTTISRQQSKRSVFCLNRIARVVDRALKFEASVDIPDMLSLDDQITQKIKSFKSNNPVVVDIELLLSNQQRQVIARGRLKTDSQNTDAYTYQLQPLKFFTFKDSDIVTGSFSLFIRLRNQTRLPYLLEDSSELDFSEPMLFENLLEEKDVLTKNVGFQLLAFGESYSYKANRALLYCPDNSNIDKSKAKVFFSRCRLNIGELIEFSGELSLKTDIFYQFKTDVKDFSHRYELVGHQVEFAKYPSVIFKGLPKVFRYYVESGARTLLNTSTQLRVRPISENAPWQVPGAELTGYYELGVFGNDKEILFKRKIGLLPKEFELSLTPKNNNMHGQIRFSDLNAQPFVGSNVHLLETESNGKDFTLSIQSATETGVPDEMFEFELRLPHREKGLVFFCPFPALGARLFDPDGKVLSDLNYTLMAHNLYGHRLKVFRSNQQEISVLFQLRDFALNGFRQDYIIERRYRFLNQKQHLMEFTLIDWEDDIRSLLIHGVSIDAKVTIEVNMNHQRLCQINVCKYLAELERNNDQQNVLLKKLSLKDFNAMTLEAFQLDAPEKTPVLLEQKQENGVLYPIWSVSELYKKEATWMIQAKDIEVRLRPILWSTNPISEQEVIPEVETEIVSLRQAVNVLTPKHRKDAIQSVLSVMSLNIEHRDWIYLKDFMNRTEGQPIEAFNLWHAVSKHSAFLACLAFQESFHSLLELIEDSITVNWYLVTLSEWEKAYQAVINSMNIMFEKEESDFIKNLIQQKLDNLVVDCFAFKKYSAFDSIKEHLQNKKTTAINDHIFFDCLINPEKNKLLQRNSEEEYPTGLQPTVIWYINRYQLNDIQSKVQSGNPSYRLPVLMMPIILAHNTFHESEMRLNPGQRFELQKIIDFDKEWFETTFNYAFGYFKI